MSEQVQKEYTIPTFSKCILLQQTHSVVSAFCKGDHITAWIAWGLTLALRFATGEAAARGVNEEGGHKKGSVRKYTTGCCWVMCPGKPCCACVHLWKVKNRNLEVTHFQPVIYRLLNCSYERDSIHTVQITLYLNFFRIWNRNLLLLMKICLTKESFHSYLSPLFAYHIKTTIFFFYTESQKTKHKIYLQNILHNKLLLRNENIKISKVQSQQVVGKQRR